MKIVINFEPLRYGRRNAGIKFIIMNNGTVKFFNDTKGFGFIKDDNSNAEYFMHVSGLIDDVRENDKVTFDLQEGKKGLNAINVKRA